MRSKRTSRIVAGIALAFVVAVVLVSRLLVHEAAEHSAKGTLPAPEPSETGPQLESGQSSVREAQATPSRTRARDVLQAYWGHLSPDAEKRVREEGIDLDMEYEVPPWSAVSEHFRTQLCDLGPDQLQTMHEAERGWPRSPTAADLEARFPIIGQRQLRVDANVLADVDLIVAETNAAIDSKVDDLVAGVDAALRSCWSMDEVERSPITTQAIPPNTRKAFYASACAHDGWAARVKLYSDRNPHLVQLKAEIGKLSRDRDASLTKYLESLPY